MSLDSRIVVQSTQTPYVKCIRSNCRKDSVNAPPSLCPVLHRGKEADSGNAIKQFDRTPVLGGAWQIRSDTPFFYGAPSVPGSLHLGPIAGRMHPNQPRSFGVTAASQRPVLFWLLAHAMALGLRRH